MKSCFRNEKFSGIAHEVITLVDEVKDDQLLGKDLVIKGGESVTVSTPGSFLIPVRPVTS